MCCLVARRGEKRAERDNRVIHYKGTVVYMLSIIVIVNRPLSIRIRASRHLYPFHLLLFKGEGRRNDTLYFSLFMGEFSRVKPPSTVDWLSARIGVVATTSRSK